MSAIDEKTFFTALGFLAVLLAGSNEGDSARRAGGIGQLIEAFCMEENKDPCAPAQDDHNPALLDSLIERLKYNFESTHQAELPSDLGILHGLYERLIVRHRWYASDDLVADAVLFFLEEENRNKNEAHMEIVRVAGDEDVFAPCQDLATKIAKILKDKGECKPSDLEAKGFPSQEIKRHWAMSYALAKVELNWMGA